MAKQIDVVEEMRILSNLGSMPGHTTTVDRAMAKALVFHETVFCGGYLRNIRAKHLGVGVYKIYTEAAK